MELFTFDSHEGRNVRAGYFNFKNKWYLKNSSDFCGKHKAYGISVDIINRLKILDCKYIIIPTSKHIIVSKFNDWISYGFTDDIGSGLQLFLKITNLKLIEL